jgi:hypothetical protein
MHKNKYLNRIVFWGSSATLIMAFILMMVAFVWIVMPYRTIDLDDFEASQLTYYAGDRVEYSFEYKKYTNFTSETTREIVNSTVFHIDSFEANAPKTPIDSWQHLHNGLTLPSNVDPGEYRIRLVSNVKVNPLRTITKVFESAPFQVIRSN